MKMITVVGYASLLSYESAKQTVPNLKNFRLAKVKGYKRIFNKVEIVFFRMDKIDASDIKISTCTTQQDKRYEIICTLFECNEDEFLDIYEREHGFKWVYVNCEEENSATKARICTEYNDEEYFLNKCITYREYYRRVEQYYTGKIWRDDILPYPRYLKHCLKAAHDHGEEVFNNFIDTSFLANGKTTIRSYLESNQDLMDWKDAEYSYNTELKPTL